MFRRPFALCLLVLATLAAPSAAFAADGDVRVNSVGYLPERAKQASIVASTTTFQVKREGDGSVAFEGKATGPKSEAGKSVWLADFSELKDKGRYYVDVQGVGRSVAFSIDPDVYDETFLASMLGFYGWRCNTAVSFTWRDQKYEHAACHMDDGHTDHIGEPGTRDGKKGWHDAGDYGKYTVNAGVTVGAMLQAWEDFEGSLRGIALPIPEAGGALPDYLDEIKWELEWLFTMQYSPTDGRVSHKLTSLDFDVFEMPEADLLTRYFVPWGSAATADFVAMLAKASRVYRKVGDVEFADRCLAAAKVSYQYLQKNPADVAPNQTGFETGGYGTSDPDDRLWAAAEMWETTGDPTALADFEARAKQMKVKVDSDFDWSNVKNLGMFVYVLSSRTGRDATLLTQVQTALKAAADKLVAQRNSGGYGRDIEGYWWGANGSLARTCMVLQIANKLGPNPDYVETCADQVSWLLGRNQYNRSQVTGLGINPPMHPHHRPSGGDDIVDPWPGLLVGGGQSATDWTDVQASYQTNEVAVNWNGAMVYAVASLLRPGRYVEVDAGPSDASSRGDSTAFDTGRSGAADASRGATGSSGRASSGTQDATSSVSSGARSGSSGRAASGATGRADSDEAEAPAASSSGGCGCAVAGAPASATTWLMALALLASRRRARRR